MLLIKESVLSLKEEGTTQYFGFPYTFKIASKYQKSFMTDPLNINFEDFLYTITKL